MTLTHLGAHIERLSDASEIWDAALIGFHDIGLELVIYLMASSDGRLSRLRTNFPEIYDDTNPEEDPFLRYCCTNYVPTKIGADYLGDYGYLPEQAQTFIQRINARGFRTGIGLPIRLDQAPKYGGFNLGSRLPKAEFEEKIWPKLPEIQTFCFILDRRLDETESTGPSELEAAQLTRRQMDVINGIADGLSRKQIALKLGISPNTVSEYTRSAYRKLGVSNRIDAARLVLSSKTRN